MGATIAASTPPDRPRRRLSNADFDRLVAEGIVREGGRAYLWDGRIIEPMAEDQPHIFAVKYLRRLLESRFSEAAWTVNTNQPIDLAEGFQPQPDLVVLRGPDSDYGTRGRRPKPADVALLIEVSVTTYPDDAGDYLRHYARAGIPQYWIVNIRARRIEVYTDPDAITPAYSTRRDHTLDESVPLVVTVDGIASAFDPVEVRAVLKNSLGGA
jgi:Uma2 family endonuclease